MSNEMKDWLRDTAVDELQARIAELEKINTELVDKGNHYIVDNSRLAKENQRLQKENEILLREKVNWILGGGDGPKDL